MLQQLWVGIRGWCSLTNMPSSLSTSVTSDLLAGTSLGSKPRGSCCRYVHPTESLVWCLHILISVKLHLVQSPNAFLPLFHVMWVNYHVFLSMLPSTVISLSCLCDPLIKQSVHIFFGLPLHQMCSYTITELID